MKILAYIMVILTFFGCKSENINDHSPGLIQVAISEVSFASEETLGNRAATPVENKIQRNTIELNKDFLMVAELRPEEPASATLKEGTRAALDTTALAANIRYRVLVYNQAGAFVTERDYIRGQEANTAALELDGGSTYTFVVLSINSTNDLPPTTPAVGIRNLANSQVNTTGTAPTALMYYKQTMTVTGNSINRLDIVLKHRKPLIGVIINSEQTGYNITAAQGRFDPHNNSTIVNLSDGSQIHNGTNVGANVGFSAVGTQNIVNTTTNYINAHNNNITSFTLLSITIGSITATNLVPFTNLSVTSGVRYNLILNIVPNDRFITRFGRPAAIINGTVWALHNVGVDHTLDPNPSIITSEYHGNYYQFGRIAITADPTDNTTNSNFNSTMSGPGWWNTGTEEDPLKSTSDPCPNGFRVPTRTEVQQLIDGVEVSNRGTFNNSNTNFGSATILTSKRNSNVVLVIPTQGYIDVFSSTPRTPAATTNRGLSGSYWTSSASSGGRVWRFLVTATGASVGELSDNIDFYPIQSRAIRCGALL